ncbi:unnamed protein product [Enterobius vermicularis]|uniref:Carbonyl reductase [NADPH] 1-like n=1 Tax=Enterobius vermicularis TaxID=51028 RepID=A0A158QBD2_ENTVE|nr:unnamed protein product [Enterobius vermicularis]
MEYVITGHVTGANKGIGYGIVKGLAEQIHNGIIYLTGNFLRISQRANIYKNCKSDLLPSLIVARNVSLGEAALKKVLEELGQKRQSEVKFHQLDITDKSSIQKLADYLNKEHDGLDVLVNNAGFAFKHAATEPAEEQARVTIGVNYEGTKQVCDILFPLIRTGGSNFVIVDRVVNVASQMGLLLHGRYSEEIITKMSNPSITVAEIEQFCKDYIKACVDNKRKERGYPESAYCVSKTAVSVLTFIQARELKSRNIVVNACCPGYVNTDMTSHKGSLTIEEGADTPIYLATLEKDEPCGQFVYLRRPIDFVAKKSIF